MPSITRRVAGSLLTAAALTGAAIAPGAAQAAPAPTPGVSVAQPQQPIQSAAYASINWKPVFANYLVCVPYQGMAMVYADFTDTNDDDASLVVRIDSAYGPNGPMGVSDGYHGVFFYKQVNLPYAHEILTVQATDPHGAKSTIWHAWLYADGSCGTPWHD